MCRIFFFKQKTAYEMRISDWSSDVCSSDLAVGQRAQPCKLAAAFFDLRSRPAQQACNQGDVVGCGQVREQPAFLDHVADPAALLEQAFAAPRFAIEAHHAAVGPVQADQHPQHRRLRSEEPTSDLQSLMRISYALF